MANKYLDLDGLQRLVNKIKALIPTKNSELLNDSGFITIEDIPGGETQITIRHQERFIVGTSSIFEFTKGYYTLNANSVNWYLDGIKQSNDTLIEIDNRTIEVVGGLPQGSTVVFDYVEYTNTVIGLEGPEGPKGEQGPPGENGYTPIKGVDYHDGEQGPPGSDAEVTNTNVINAIGYIPLNKTGDVMSGGLNVEGRLTVQGGMTFKSYGQHLDFNAATMDNITSLSTRGAKPSFIMGIDYNGYPATLNHGFVVNVKNATSGRGLASNKAYHVVDTQDPANPILKFGVSSVGVVEAETYKTLDGIEVSYEGHTHQVSDIEGLENVGSGGTTIITSATEPTLNVGDQWHKEI